MPAMSPRHVHSWKPVLQGWRRASSPTRPCAARYAACAPVWGSEPAVANGKGDHTAAWGGHGGQRQRVLTESFFLRMNARTVYGAGGGNVSRTCFPAADGLECPARGRAGEPAARHAAAPSFG